MFNQGEIFHLEAVQQQTVAKPCGLQKIVFQLYDPSTPIWKLYDCVALPVLHSNLTDSSWCITGE